MKKYTLSLFILLLVILTACNMPAQNDGALSLEDQAGTLAAQTLTAAAQVPTATRVPANTPTPPLPTVTLVPTLSPTPTIPPNLPTDPSLKNYNFYCSWNGSSNDLNVTIEWTDKATDEDGYKLYRNNEEIANLAPNTVLYVDQYAVNSSVNITYAIEAYNKIGVSHQVSFSVACQ